MNTRRPARRGPVPRPAGASDIAAAIRAAAGFLLPERSTFATTPVSSPRRRPVRRPGQYDDRAAGPVGATPSDGGGKRGEPGTGREDGPFGPRKIRTSGRQ